MIEQGATALPFAVVCRAQRAFAYINFVLNIRVLQKVAPAREKHLQVIRIATILFYEIIQIISIANLTAVWFLYYSIKLKYNFLRVAIPKPEDQLINEKYKQLEFTKNKTTLTLNNKNLLASTLL